MSQDGRNCDGYEGELSDEQDIAYLRWSQCEGVWMSTSQLIGVLMGQP